MSGRDTDRRKGFAERLCRNKWVLNIDADEVVTPELAAEIQALFPGGRAPEPSAYRLRILTVYPGEDKPRPWANDYNEVRLYHRSVAAYREHPVHDRVILRNTGRGSFAEPIFHHSYLSFFSHHRKKQSFQQFPVAEFAAPFCCLSQISPGDRVSAELPQMLFWPAPYFRGLERLLFRALPRLHADDAHCENVGACLGAGKARRTPKCSSSLPPPTRQSIDQDGATQPSLVRLMHRKELGADI